MKLIRSSVFETNSSSTHSLSIGSDRKLEDYTAKNSTILVRFTDTDDEYTLTTLEEKVSYLVSHIVNYYKYNSATYEDLIEDVQNDQDFKHLEDFVQEHYHKRIVFPVKYSGDLEDIVNINHQLLEPNLDDVLEDIVGKEGDCLSEVLATNTSIVFGRG